jgi:hypothetical protein
VRILRKTYAAFIITGSGTAVTLAKMIFMENKSIEPRGDEEIRDENEFLKMKLMLEQGAIFGGAGGLPADVENDFLNYIVEFEKQAANPVMTTVYRKIGCPDIFPKVEILTEEEIETHWEKLENYMRDHGVSLGCCSPNISSRELYRFTTEELFNHEVSDFNIPGMLCGFIYDEFYPDHKYENTNTAVDDVISGIFEKKPLHLAPWLLGETISLNQFTDIPVQEFLKMINQFKDLFDSIELRKVEADSCEIIENHCRVRGYYEAKLFYGANIESPSGKWTIDFNGIDGLWAISQIELEGLFIKPG